MKRKELMKRALSLALCAMMTVGTLPSVTYASDLSPADTGVVSQAEEADETQSAEEAAQAYLKENFIDATDKVITTGGNGVVKSEDGLTYNIGLKTPNGGSINSLRLKYLNTVYKTGWYIDKNNPYISYLVPTKNGSRSIKSRPASPYSFTATLKLFASDTENSAIDDGTATALATQDFTFILEAAEAEYKMQVAVQDEDKNPVTGATITVEKDGWDTVTPASDGSYKMENGASYKLTVKKDGYTDYSETFTYTGNSEEPVFLKTVTLSPIMMQNIRFSVKDKASSAEISGTSIKVKKGYYTTVSPESDGSYKLQKGVSYNWTVEAPNYKTANGTITPDEDTTIDVELEKNITSYAVTFQPMDGDTAITNFNLKVEEEVEDDWGDTDWETMTANGDGSYTLSKYGTYRYSVTAEGYKDVKNVSYAPTGSEEKITAAVNMDKDVTVDSADQAAVDKVKEIFDKEPGAIRTSYKNASNINTLIEAKLKTGDYAAVDKADQVTVSVVSSDDTDWISTDGIIHYSTADTLNASGINSKTISVVLKFSLNDATAETAECRVVIGWDQKHFASKMKSEADQLTWDRIKGENTSQTEVTSNLTLPQCMGTSLRTVWSTISWTSSNPDVISIQKPSIDSPIYAATGVINQPVEDTEVTLTATFTANKSVMNEQVEKISDINTISVPFTVTVKGTGKPAPTEAELKAILNQYYKITDLVYYGTTTVIDPEACTGDIQLPRYTRIKDENSENVFNNKEITVTSDNDAVKINGYKANVDVFQTQDTTVNLTVSFTREGVTVSRVFPITIKKLTQEDLDKEVEMMDYAKAHYFDGIKGNNVSADKITENLHPFQEMYFDADGNAVWVYNISDVTDAGICADGYFDDPWEMEGAGYNKFRSSNNAVIQHENLVVIRPETPTEITITSWLSSERYGKYASSHPGNEALQKLYKQEVSVTVTVQPDSKVAEQLQTAIDHAQTLLDSVTEGTGAGQYPEGTRDKLQTAITEAKALLEREDAAETEIEQKVTKITALISTIQNSQNETEALVTVKINQEAGKGMDVSKMTVKAHTAANYGYSKPAAYKNKVTALDVLVAWHAAQYKDAFKANPTDYLAVNNGFINKIYGIETYSIGICVNDQIPGSSTIAEALVSSGDSVSVFMYGDLKKYQDIYLYFKNVPETIQAGESVSLTLWGMHPMDYDESGNVRAAVVQKGYTVAAVDEDGNTAVSAVTDTDGKAVLNIPSAGTYQITVAKAPDDSTESAYILPKDTLLVTSTADRLTIPEIDENTDLSSLQIKDRDKILKEGRDYTINKTADGLNVTVKFTFLGAYSGEITKTYTLMQPATEESKKQLQTAVDNARKLLDSVTEGTEGGQYPLGTKEKLKTAITRANALLGKDAASENEIKQQISAVTSLIEEVQDSQKEESALVTVKINQEAGKGMDVRKMFVKAHTAADYGYSKPAAYKNRVTVLDVLAAWHAAQYKDAFKANPTDYLAVSGGFINKIYGIETYSFGFCVNDQIPGSASAAEAVVSSGDSVSVFMYGDLKQYKDIYLYFENVPETIQAGEKLDLTLWGMHPMDYDEKGNLKPASVQKGYTVAAVDANGNAVVSAITDENGKASLTIPSGGTYQITVVKAPKDSTESAYILPKDIVMAIGKETESETETEPSKHEHSFGAWKTVSAATVFSAEKQERVCACGEKETRTVGTALTPSIKVNMTVIPLKVKQTTTKFKVSGLANGDSIVSYTSSNPKVFTVDKNGKIKAGKKKDHAVLTITLKSGLKKTVKVNVQKTAVKTKKIQGLSKTITLKKGSSVKLKPVLKPLTSQQKLTYTSSNKKVVTVSSKGVIKAKKSGKVTITVKSGSKKVKIKVTVK